MSLLETGQTGWCIKWSLAMVSQKVQYGTLLPMTTNFQNFFTAKLSGKSGIKMSLINPSIKRLVLFSIVLIAAINFYLHNAG